MEKKDQLRVFVAFPLPEKNFPSFIHLQELNSSLPEIKWTEKLNLHITLFFIGEIETIQLEKTIQLLNEWSHTFSKFQLSFERYELKGKLHRPEMIWARFKPSQQFQNAAKELAQWYDFAPHAVLHKDPIAHCTLARIKKKIEANRIRLAALPMDDFTIDAAELWQTTGGIYKRICTFPLQA